MTLMTLEISFLSLFLILCQLFSPFGRLFPRQLWEAFWDLLESDRKCLISELLGEKHMFSFPPGTYNDYIEAFLGESPLIKDKTAKIKSVYLWILFEQWCDKAYKLRGAWVYENLNDFIRSIQAALGDMDYLGDEEKHVDGYRINQNFLRHWNMRYRG